MNSSNDQAKRDSGSEERDKPMHATFNREPAKIPQNIDGDEGDEPASATFNREPAKIPQNIDGDEGDEPASATFNREPAKISQNIDSDEGDEPAPATFNRDPATIPPNIGAGDTLDAYFISSNTYDVDQHSQNEASHSTSHHSESDVTRKLKKFAFPVVGLFMFAFDMGFDIGQAVDYFNQGE